MHFVFINLGLYPANAEPVFTCRADGTATRQEKLFPGQSEGPRLAVPLDNP